MEFVRVATLDRYIVITHIVIKMIYTINKLKLQLINNSH